ncbi:MAG: DMT family transporter [Cyanobacteria bacterium SID2]|nr:DMT family transporter [Cyanobacteria bacterium SID2]MBP0006741.1 DMT family transporter [Cyanobacteria bacterium SBC]
METQPSTLRLSIVLLVGILAVSTAAIWIRIAIDATGGGGVGLSLVLATSRLFVSALVLLPTWPRVRWWKVSPQALGFAAAAGVFLAANFAAWTMSLSYTSIAASTAIVTSNPLWVALLSWWCFGDRISRQTAIGMAVALVGGVIVGTSGGSETSVATNPWLGNALALAGSWAVSIYLLLGREAQQRGLSVGGYIVVAYTVAAIVLIPFPSLLGVSYLGYPRPVYVSIVLLALLPQLIGHTSINWTVRWVSPTFVTLAILLEPVCSSLLGYWIFKEVPSFDVLIGAIVLLFGVAIAAFDTSSR